MYQDDAARRNRKRKRQNARTSKRPRRRIFQPASGALV
jgi:hypothetical protein